MTFAGWTADTDAVWFADASAASTTFSMPAAPVTVTAQYTQDQDILIDTPEETSGEEPQTETPQSENQEENGSGDPILPPALYEVTVENGQGGGSYEAGATVTVWRITHRKAWSLPAGPRRKIFS